MITSIFFLLMLLFTVVSLFAILIAVVRGRRKSWLTWLRNLGIVQFVYWGTLIGVSMASKEEEIGLGQEKCFDDWCVTVRGWKKGVIGPFSANAKQYVIVTIDVANEARRADMTPDHPRAVLVDDNGISHGESDEGTRAYAQANGDQPPLGKHVMSGESYTTTLVFDVPAGSAHAKLFIAEGSWPTPWIISDENSYFHARRVTTLY